MGAMGLTETVPGVTAMETSGLVTVRVAAPEIPESVAEMVEVAPGVTPVARPPAVMVAPAVAAQVTDVVRLLVVPSE